jgi:hypothetical protein
MTLRSLSELNFRLSGTGDVRGWPAPQQQLRDFVPAVDIDLNVCDVNLAKF